jgi:hypothetical protein
LRQIVAAPAAIAHAGDALLRRHVRTDHFQRVELRGDLEESALVFRRPVHLAHVAAHDARLEPA